MTRKDRRVIGHVRALDSTRARRASQVTSAGEDVSAPLTLDRNGRRGLELGGNLFVNGKGQLDQRIGGDLEISPSSPRQMRIRKGRGVKSGRNGVELDTDGSIQFEGNKAMARPTASQVLADASTQSLGSTLAEMILRLQSNKANALDVAASVAALQALLDSHTASIAALQAAIAALQANTVGAGTGLAGGGAVASNPVLTANRGSGSDQVPPGNDSRFIWARGETALVLGQRTVSVPGISSSAHVMLSRKTPLGTSLGLALDFSISGNNLTIRSLLAGITVQVLDLSVIQYVVWNP